MDLCGFVCFKICDEFDHVTGAIFVVLFELICAKYKSRFQQENPTEIKPTSAILCHQKIAFARAPVDAHNICLSEPLAPIMKFPDRDTVCARGG